MAAATADREAIRSEGWLKAHPVAAAAKIYKGTLVCANATGWSQPAADTANFKFQGVSYEQADNTAGANGAIKCRVEKQGEYQFVYGPGGGTQALVGKQVFVLDDSTVTDAATVNNIACGTIVELVSATVVRIRIGGKTN
jgi:hypothetical protein